MKRLTTQYEAQEALSKVKRDMFFGFILVLLNAIMAALSIKNGDAGWSFTFGIFITIQTIFLVADMVVYRQIKKDYDL